MIFYMATRYEGENGEPDLVVIDTIPTDKFTTEPVHAKLDALLDWHISDPVDDFERNRNEVVCSYQGNRNPFIDHPEYIDKIWGDNETPEITGISFDPTSPIEGESITVSATITDPDGTISSTNIKYGTSSGIYTHTITMTNVSGDTYSGTIPAQTAGTTIYFIVEAIDNSADTSESSEYSFTVTAANVAPEISNISIDPVSPTELDNVSISATITDSDGTISTANIKYGTSTGNYTQSVSMTNTSSDTYSGTIPLQSAGTTVYYIIDATDNDTEKTESSEQNYTVSLSNIAPEISEISNNPASPTEEEDVIVSSTIIDSDGTISSVNIKYGVVAGVYTQTILMTNTSGDLYSGTIPKQIAGTTIYFVIEATDNDAKTTTSSEQNVTFTEIPNVFPEITNIQHSPISPDEMQNVTINAIITDSDGAISSANIKWGPTAGTYPNKVSMSCGSGKDSGIIPGQVGGTIIYFVIVAEDDDGDETQSSENDFSFNSVGNINPEITNISFNPIDPESTESVLVTANVADSDGIISNTDLKWGTVSGIYNNTISMSNTGDAYSGTIPALTDGTHVYFIIQAVDNDGGTDTSNEIDYTVANPVNNTPVISNISFDPTNPESTESVLVYADITDLDGTITNADLKWGTSTGVYGNTISMTNSGDTYSGTIPAQVDGEHVYFLIYAEDNESESAQSNEIDYIVSDPILLNPVVSDVNLYPVNPTEDDNVIVSAVANDSDGSIETVVLSWKWGSSGIYSDIYMNLSGDKYYGQIPKQTSGEIIYFTIVATDNDALEGTFDGNYEVYTPSGTIDINQNNLRIYPNPTKDILTINCNERMQFELHSLSGKILISKTIKEKTSLGTIHPGIYLIILKDESGTIIYSNRLIKL